MRPEGSQLTGLQEGGTERSLVDGIRTAVTILQITSLPLHLFKSVYLESRGHARVGKGGAERERERERESQSGSALST